MKALESILKIIIVALALLLVSYEKNNATCTEKIAVSEIVEENKILSGNFN